MLKGINPIISPELLKILSEMGHGDEILLADIHFPGVTICPTNVLRGDGVDIPHLLEGILPLLELDSYDNPLIMMAPVKGDELDPKVEENYMTIIQKHVPWTSAPIRLERFTFYERAEKAFACIITGTTAKYGNLILKKGVTPVE